MMSSDQNVKILERLVRNLKRYVDLKLESLRLDAVSRITMLISALVIGVAVLLPCFVGSRHAFVRRRGLLLPHSWVAMW